MTTSRELRQELNDHIEDLKYGSDIENYNLALCATDYIYDTLEELKQKQEKMKSFYND